MPAVHALLGWLLHAVFAPFDRLAPMVGLVLVSALCGMALLWVFRWTSNPRAIRAARRRAQAHLLAIRLYREDLRVVVRAQASFLVWLGRYLGHMLVPFAALIVPFALIFAHLDARYASRALRPGERAVVKAIVAPARFEDWTLRGADGVEIESAPVRIRQRGEIAWRIRARAPGRHRIALLADDRRVDKEVRVSIDGIGAAPRRMTAGLASLLLAPAEAAIDEGTGVERIEIAYPALELRVFGWQTDWLIVFLVVSAGVALALRRRAGVEF